VNNTTKDIFFRILRSAIYDEHLNLEGVADVDWDTLLECFHRHRLLTLVADVIINLPEQFLPDDQHQLHIMNECASSMQRHREINETVVMAMRRLEAAGCEPVLLKGAGYASLYSNPTMRCVGDVDIYVGNNDINKAVSEVNSWCSAEELENAELSGHHYEVNHNGVVIEIHYCAGTPFNLYNADRYNALAKEYLQPERCDYAMINGEKIRVPALPFNAYYCYMHIMQHLSGEGIGLRQFVDWAMIMHRLKKEDFSCKMLADNELKAWQALGGILVKQLGIDKERFPLYDERQAMRSQDLLLQLILDGDSFSMNTGVTIDESVDKGLKRKWKILRSVVERAKVMYTLHPSIAFTFLKQTFLLATHLKRYNIINLKQ